MELNKVYQGDCLEVMKTLPDSCIDMVLTSPPYDNMRVYIGSLEWGQHVWEPVIQELFRIIKDGGVVVWIVNDGTVNGSESGSSFRQALYFKEVGFNLHDTMIYAKNNPIPLTHNRYEQQFEYMFVFSKGKPKTFNPILIECKHGGEEYKFDQPQCDTNSAKRYSDTKRKVKSTKQNFNIWFYSIGGMNKRMKTEHPAVFPEKLVQDHLTSWSNKGDVVLDPFAGSGTVGKIAKQMDRNYVLIEKESKYVELIRTKLNTVISDMFK